MIPIPFESFPEIEMICSVQFSHGLALNRKQAIVLTKDDIVCRRMYA